MESLAVVHNEQVLDENNVKVFKRDAILLLLHSCGVESSKFFFFVLGCHFLPPPKKKELPNNQTRKKCCC